MASELGCQAPGRWADYADVRAVIESGGLPFARVEEDKDWWYAASQAVPQGPEVLRHLHKRPAQRQLEQFTTARSVNIATGPDKSLRIPQYLRASWLVIQWQAMVTDPDLLARWLFRVGGLGKMITHGNGWIKEWSLSTGHRIVPLTRIYKGESYEVGAVLDDFRTVSRRHIPARALTSIPPKRTLLRRIPLRPPYHTGFDPDFSRAVYCWQMP
jgi:hypothetical protein